MKTTTKDIRKNVMHVLGGTILTEKLIIHNKLFIAIVLLIIIFYISNRYSCIEKVAQIEELQSRLKKEKYESLAVSSQLTSISRQTQVQALVNKENLGLELSKTPVYKIEK